MYDFVGQVVDYDVTLGLQQMKCLRFQAWTIGEMYKTGST